MPLAFFSVLVAVSSTKTLLTIFIISLTTLTISIKIRNGITFSNEIDSLDKISSLPKTPAFSTNHPFYKFH